MKNKDKHKNTVNNLTFNDMVRFVFLNTQFYTVDLKNALKIHTLLITKDNNV